VKLDRTQTSVTFEATRRPSRVTTVTSLNFKQSEEDSSEAKKCLNNYLDELKKLNWKNKLTILLKIAHQISQLHKLDQVHGNIDGYTIFKIVNNWILETESLIETEWQAPEIALVQVPPSKASDIFQFAFILLIFLKCKLPWDNKGMNFIRKNIHLGHRPNIGSKLESPKGFIPLLEKCWDQIPYLRPSIDDVIKELELMLKHQCVATLLVE